jgi:hypothetical protein
MMTDDFASRRAGVPMKCEEMEVEPPACRDAHSDVVLWSTWTSFFSNTIVSVVLVGQALHEWRLLPVLAVFVLGIAALLVNAASDG